MKVSIQNNDRRILIKAEDNVLNIYSTSITVNDPFVINFCNKDLNIFEKLIKKYELEENDGYYNFNIIEPIFLTYKLNLQENSNKNISKELLNKIEELQDENKILNKENEKKNEIIKNLNNQISSLENKINKKIKNGENKGVLSDFVMIEKKIVNKNLKYCKISFGGFSSITSNLIGCIIFCGIDNTDASSVTANIGLPSEENIKLINCIDDMFLKINLFENIENLFIEITELKIYCNFIRKFLLPKLKDNKNIKSYTCKCKEQKKEFKDVNEIEDYLNRVGHIFQ